MLRKNVLCISALALSAIFFVTAAVTDRVVFLILGIPFFLNLLILFHEIGHAFGCAINGNTVTEIKTPVLIIAEHGVKFCFEPGVKSYCAFRKSDNDVVVFLCGPGFSLLMAAALAVLAYVTGSSMLFLSAFFAAVYFLKHLVPIRDSDMKMILSEARKKKKV